jgi:sulfite dehydrogenase (cytochrome) subunit B
MLRPILFATLLIAAPAWAEDPATLKPGPDLETVTNNCGACHSLAYIRMNSTFLTPDGWKAEVTKMRKAFGGPIDDQTAETIVKYLSANYAVAPKQ